MTCRAEQLAVLRAAAGLAPEVLPVAPGDGDLHPVERTTADTGPFDSPTVDVCCKRAPTTDELGALPAGLTVHIRPRGGYLNVVLLP